MKKSCLPHGRQPFSFRP